MLEAPTASPKSDEGSIPGVQSITAVHMIGKASDVGQSFQFVHTQLGPAGPTHTTFDAKVAITSIVHTRQWVYAANRGRNSTIFRWDRQKLFAKSSGGPQETANTSINDQVVQLAQISEETVQTKATFLLILTESRLFYLNEDYFLRRAPEPIPDIKPRFLATVSPQGYPRYAIVADAQSFHFFEMNTKAGPEARLDRKKESVPHGMKVMQGLIGGNDSIFCYDKKEWACWDFRGALKERQPIQRPFKFIVPIQDRPGPSRNFSFLIVYQDLTLGVFPAGPVPAGLSISREVAAIAGRIPYIYSFCERGFQIAATIGGGHINDSLELPQQKFKNPIIDVMENYDVLLVNDSTIMAVKYQHVQPHIDKLTGERCWDNALELCRSLSPAIDTEDVLARLHWDHSTFLFAKREYDQAFAQFRASRKHPFQMLRRFKSFVPQRLRELARADVDAYLNLAGELKMLYDQGAPTNALVEKIKLLKRQMGDQSETKANEVQKNMDNDAMDLQAAIRDAEALRGELDQLVLTDPSMGYTGNDCHAINALNGYVDELLREVKQSTLRKIYFTIRFECIANNKQLELPAEIAKNNPIFFEVAAEALKTSNTNEAFLLLCELHHEHTHATQFIWPDRNTAPPVETLRRLIRYVSNSVDVITLAPQWLTPVFNTFKSYPAASDSQDEAALDFAVQLYFSEKLKGPGVDNACQQIATHSGFTDQQRQRMQIMFLDFAIFVLKDDRPAIHTGLIALYLELLKEFAKYREGRKPTAIAQEKPGIRVIREKFVHLLDESDCYQPKATFRSIPPPFLEERLSAQRKANDIKEAIETVAAPEVPLPIAIAFCDIVWAEDDPGKSDVYNQLFFFLGINQGGSDNSRLLGLLNSRAERLDPVRIVENIPKTIPFAQLKDYLRASLLGRINKLRSLKIRNALMAATIEAKRVQLRYLQSGRVEVKDNLICVFCGKQIGDSVFYVQQDNCVAHAACNANAKKKSDPDAKPPKLH
jgi:hypothetical protein